MALAQGSVRGYLKFIDDQGQDAKTSFYLKGADTAAKIAALSSLQEAVQAITDTAVNEGSFTIEMADSTPVSPSDGPYENVEDKAVVIMYSTTGERVRYEIAGPIDGIFEADKETLDRVDALVIALIAALVQYASDKAGNALVDMYKGYRKRAKTQR